MIENSHYFKNRTQAIQESEKQEYNNDYLRIKNFVDIF